MTTDGQVIISASGWRSLAPRPPCPACAATRAALEGAGVLRRPPEVTPLPAEVDARPYLALDAAGRASAAASVAGLVNDQRAIDGALRRMPSRNRKDT